MKFKLSLLVLVFLLTSSGCLFSQKSVRIQKTTIQPTIDGLLNDKCWETAASIDEFLQREPDEGQPMTEKTEVYICFDANYLYFGIKCHQDPKTITVSELLRDASTPSDDRIHILLDTYFDHRNSYLFRITSLGAIQDAIISQNGTIQNNNWNGLWVAKSKITAEGWETEVSIPFKSVSFDKKSDRWGLRINRYISKNREYGSWPNGNLDSELFQISDAGIIEGLEGITQGIGLDISPYLIAGFDSKRGDRTKYKINGGTDVFYQVTPSLKASFSINTDFAETEADSRQINLTRFSLRLSEKRNFFLDGANYFSYGLEGMLTEPPSGKISPFFSRTIGLDASGSPIPVNYGAKLTGQLKNWNIGMLHVSDDRNYGNSHFSVARITRNIGKQSSIGMISTHGNSIDSTRNFLAGLDLNLTSSKFMGDKNIALVLFGIKSVTENIQGRDLSWGGAFTYPNDFITFRLGHVEIGENFISGMGYVPRTNIKETFGALTFGPRLNKWGIRQFMFGGDFDYVTDFANNLQSKVLNLSPVGIQFESGEKFNYSLCHRYDFLENDFNIYADYIIPADEYQWWENNFSLMTDPRRKLSGRILYGSGNFYAGNQNALEITANWRVMIPVFIGVTYKTNIVDLPEGKFVADIYQLNMNFLFSPDITLHNYFQFDSQSEIIGWQSRFQWILKPGNEILLVWNSGFSNPIERYVMNESALRFKLKYNIRF